MVLDPCQVQEGPNIHFSCAIIASCFEMDVYRWLDQDSLNAGCHFRSRRWGKEWCIEKILWLKSISNSLASIDIFWAMWRCGTILTYSPRRSTTSRNLTMKVSKASDIHTGSSWGRRQGGRRKCHSIIFGNIRQSLEKGSLWLEYVYIRFLDSLNGEGSLAVMARCPNSPRVQE